MNTVAHIHRNSTNYTSCAAHCPPVPCLLAVPGPGAADAVVVVVQQASPHHHPALGPAPGHALSHAPRRGEGVGPGQHAQRQPGHGGRRREAAGERGISIKLIKI